MNDVDGTPYYGLNAVSNGWQLPSIRRLRFSLPVAFGRRL